MTRPALIIGLGGTGQWVLTYLKKNLIESNNGTLPENVTLLCLDTMPQERSAGGDASAGGGGYGVQVGLVHLETDSEFVCLGADLWPMIQAVLEDEEQEQPRFSHIASWLWLEGWRKLRPLIRSLGSMQASRQLARLALFNDLGNPSTSKVQRQLDAAFDRLIKQLHGQRLEIMVVGSLAGNTGSGLFLDMAVLARERARDVPNSVSGYLFLPGVFVSEPDQVTKARCFAAWRELNRFMTVNGNVGMSSLIQYADNGSHSTEIRNRVFDTCYLIDGKQGEERISAEPQGLVFPAIADAICAELDDTAGGRFSELKVCSLAPVYAARPDIPLYSTIGSYSFKTPVHNSQLAISHQLAMGLLVALVQPICDDATSPRRVTRVGNVSPYDRCRVGRDDALDLLVRDFSYDGQSEASTLFTKTIADGVRDRGGLPHSWLTAFVDFGDRPDLRELTTNIASSAQLLLTTVVKSSKELGEDPRLAPRRFARQIPAFVREYFGGQDNSGKDSGGIFGNAVQKASALQVDIFRRNARLWLLYTLMGSDSKQPVAGKAGRIGYADDLLNGLREHLSAFLEFMAKVDEKRRGDDPAQLHWQLECAARADEMDRLASKRILGLWVHPQVHRSQESYLQAEQALIHVRADEMLHHAVVETVQQMQAHVQKMQAELAGWIRTLAAGDQTTGVGGLFNELSMRRATMDAAAQADAMLESQTIVAVPSRSEYPEELEQGMGAMTWTVTPVGEPFAVRLAIKSSEIDKVELERLSGEARASWEINQRNLDAMLGYAQRLVVLLPGEMDIAQCLADQFDYEAYGFLQSFQGKAEPFFRRHRTRMGGPVRWSRLICISMDLAKMEPRTFTFVQDIQRKLRETNHVDLDVKDQDKLVQVVGSSDTHKATAVYTDDLYPVELFEAWEDCMNAYLKGSQYPPAMNHNFRAEVTAVRYEAELSRRYPQDHQMLHPWVVTLLEHEDRLMQFLCAWSLGWIKPLTGEHAEEGYELRLPDWTRGLVLTRNHWGTAGLFRTMCDYGLVGLDQTPRSTWSVNYAEVQQALAAEENTAGCENWARFLESQLREESDGRMLLSWVVDHVADLGDRVNRGESIPADEPANYAEAYEDLAAVGALMFSKRIKAMRQQSNVTL